MLRSTVGNVLVLPAVAANPAQTDLRGVSSEDRQNGDLSTPPFNSTPLSHVRFRGQTCLSNAEITAGRFDARHSATPDSTNTYRVATQNSCPIPALTRPRLEPQKFDDLPMFLKCAQNQRKH